jgi:Tropinone reductase 1
MVAPVIIVTGVSRGIGRAVAEELQARGAVVGAARNVVDVPATAGLLPVAADVTQETGRKAIVEAALDQLTRSLAAEWGPDGIRVNAVLPWVTRTQMAQKVLEDRAYVQKVIAATPLRRLAEPADVAFLALPDSDYISGQLLAVDGGYLAQGLPG